MCKFSNGTILKNNLAIRSHCLAQPWSSLVKITSNSTISWVVYLIKLKRLPPKTSYFCWLEKLSGMPVTPHELNCSAAQLNFPIRANIINTVAYAEAGEVLWADVLKFRRSALTFGGNEGSKPWITFWRSFIQLSKAKNFLKTKIFCLHFISETICRLVSNRFIAIRVGNEEVRITKMFFTNFMIDIVSFKGVLKRQMKHLSIEWPLFFQNKH